MIEMQRTISSSIKFSGIGIHTGVVSNMTLKPSEEDTGVKFIRTDLKDKPIINAHIDFLFKTERSTSLKNKEAEIQTVEHILAAITGLGIDNIIIEVDNIEIPILDGSAREFSRKIKQVGVKNQKKKRKHFILNKTVTFTNPETGAEFIAKPCDHYEIEAKIDYNSKVLGTQDAHLKNITDFQNEIASSRTFCFLHELEEMLENNLVKGGDINNAIIIVENKIPNQRLSKLKRIFNNPNIQVDNRGYLNNLELRHENEAARHKLLDMIGDFSLVGMPIKAKITAFKPGHKDNTKFAKKLKEAMNEQLKKIAPEINLDEKPLYNKEKIKSILPHRDPFLFIDEIREIGDDYIVGVKFVKKEEEYFKGHFPGEPVMPGVLQLETMAQTGGVLILETVENPQEYLTFFMKIDNAKFKQKVVPGDIIIFKLHLISPIRRGLCHMHGVGFVNNKIVVEADLLAQIAQKK